MAVVLREQNSPNNFYFHSLKVMRKQFFRSFSQYGAPRLSTKIQSEKVGFPDHYCLQLHRPRRAKLITFDTSILSLSLNFQLTETSSGCQKLTYGSCLCIFQPSLLIVALETVLQRETASQVKMCLKYLDILIAYQSVDKESSQMCNLSQKTTEERYIHWWVNEDSIKRQNLSQIFNED